MMEMGKWKVIVKGMVMFKDRRILLFGMLIVFSSGSFAFIYEVVVLKKWDPQAHRYQYVIGCSDFHDKQHQSTSDQVAAIHEMLQASPKDTTKIIVEDLSSENNCGKRACKSFLLNSRGGILGGLSETCKKYGFNVDNVEYRYCRVIALGPVVTGNKKDYQTLPSVQHIKVHDVLNEVKQVIAEIQQYNDDHNELKRVYKKQLSSLQAHLKRLHFDKHVSDSMAHYLNKHTNKKNLMEILKYLLTFDSMLLDMKMLHSVHTASQADRIIAFAGGTHITRVAQALKKMGYEEVYTSKSSYEKEHNLEKCTGSHIVEGSFCVRPQPVDAAILRKLTDPASL